MEICDFIYHRPHSLADACRLGRELGREARFHAGGTELLVDFRHRRDAASHLISLRDLPELARITEGEDGGLRIGAMATLADLTESPLVAARFPVLKQAALTMAGAQIRNQGTIGGNFCRAVSCADTPPVCMVGEARVRLIGPDGERTLPAEDFFTGPRQTVLTPGELLVEILIPPQPARSGASYQRFSLRRGQALAVAAVAARLVLDDDGKIADARIGLTAVAPTPLLATGCASRLRGQPPGADVFAAAASAAAAEAQPINDLRGSAGLPPRAGGGAHGPRAARPASSGHGEPEHERARPRRAHGQRHAPLRRRQAQRHAQAGDPRRARPHRHQERLRGRGLRRLHRDHGRPRGHVLPGAGRRGRRVGDHHDRGAGGGRASCTPCRSPSSSTARCSAASARRA